jgi:LacI family transcriptional regulator
MPNHDDSGNVTLLDVARHLGVSRATVSLVLRNSPSVAEKTRKRVLQGIDELGYVYNRSAASMRSKQSKTIGVVINDITNPYFSTLIRSIERTLNRHGFITFISNSDESVERQSWFFKTIRQHNIDGIIICPAEDSKPSDFQAIIDWKIPCVFASRYIPNLEADYVGTDNHLGAKTATEHLIHLGHKRIAMIGGLTRSSTGRDRLNGYLDALSCAGVKRDEKLIFPAPLTRDEGKRIISNLLKLKNPPTAAVCGNDVIAFGVMLGLQAKNIQVGKDFSLIGFDDVPEAALWEPALSTVQIQQDAIGEAAADLLIKRLSDKNKPVSRVIVNPTLLLRKTCGTR